MKYHVLFQGNGSFHSPGFENIARMLCTYPESILPTDSNDNRNADQLLYDESITLGWSSYQLIFLKHTTN